MSDDPARDEYKAARAEAREKRYEFAKSGGLGFARTMESAMRQFREARRQGMTFDVAVKGIEAELRAAWPRKTTKYPPQCDACDDTGWRIFTCWHEQRCGRKRCAEAHPAHEHTYAARCECPKGQPAMPAAGEAIAAVGRTQQKRKPREFTRFGA